VKQPRWREADGYICQWPRCKDEGTTHYTLGSTKWIVPEEGVDLCDRHTKEMHSALFPDPVGPEVGTKLWLRATEDYPREQVEVLDWWYTSEVIVLTSEGEVPYTEFECEEA